MQILFKLAGAKRVLTTKATPETIHMLISQLGRASKMFGVVQYWMN